MEVRKAAQVAGVTDVTDSQLAKINRQAKTPLGREQVYVFSVRLCDDQVDRDNERFDKAALPKLAELFIGRTGIVDHSWSTGNQMARIFDTSVEREGAVSYIKAWAYMLRGEKTQHIIDEIEAGIKKEVSVGCAMGKSRCSICGEDIGSCKHEKGREYHGQICVAVLSEPMDAYEFSFVAVPAQKQAGVIKGWKGGEQMNLDQFVAKGASDMQKEQYSQLQKQAQLGRQYLGQLKQDVVKLALTVDLGVEEESLRKMASQLDIEELTAMEQALRKKQSQLFPPQCQLPQGRTAKHESHSEFMI